MHIGDWMGNWQMHVNMVECAGGGQHWQLAIVGWRADESIMSITLLTPTLPSPGISSGGDNTSKMLYILLSSGIYFNSDILDKLIVLNQTNWAESALTLTPCLSWLFVIWMSNEIKIRHHRHCHLINNQRVASLMQLYHAKQYSMHSFKVH